MRNFMNLAVLLWAALVSMTLQAAPEFPPLTGRVVDRAELLSPQAEQQLSTLLARHEQATSSQVVVVTLNTLQGYAISEYGYQLGRHWEIGQQGRDNGVLLIVAPNEKEVRIEVGYGLEGSLTDALSKNIIETEITPRFRQGDMEGGIVNGTRAILGTIEGSYKPQKRSRAGKSGSAFDFFGAAVILSMIFGGVIRSFIGNRLLASVVLGGIAGLIGFLIFSIAIGVFAGIAVFLIQLLTGTGRGGGGGFYGGGYYGGGYSSGGGFGGGFSGGGGGFGGGGASGGW
jgi:uncharacterized protein